jgi:hypothetical protein
MPSNNYLMLRSARRARLEARAALLQLIFSAPVEFPDILLRQSNMTSGSNTN